MGHGIGDVLPLAIGTAISPVPVIAVTPVLGMAIGEGIGSPTS